MFGLENIGKGSVTEAREAVKDLTARLDPLISHVVNGFGWVLHSVLNRITCNIKVEIGIKPMTKEEFENPPPD